MVGNLNSLAKILLLFLSVNSALSTNLNSSVDTRISSTCTVSNCTDNLRNIVNFLYSNNYDNFNEVLRFSNVRSDLNFKADVLLILNDIMSTTMHREDPFRALRLYNTIAAFLEDSNYVCLQEEKRTALQNVKQYLLWYPIRERGADILTSAILSDSCNTNNTIFTRWCDAIDASDDLVWRFVISTTVNRVRYTLPFGELISSLSRFSQYLRHNVEAMLVLVEEFYVRGVDQMDYLEKLYELKQHRDYIRIIDLSTQSRVDNQFPAKLKQLYSGKICIYQHLSNGSRIYVYKCEVTNRLCTYAHPFTNPRAVYNTQIVGNLTGFNFKSGSRPLTLTDEVTETEGITLNVIFPINNDYNPGYSSNWKVQLLDDEQLFIQDASRTMTLCAGSNAKITWSSPYPGEWFAYTRKSSQHDIHKEECRWYIEDCTTVEIED